MISALHAQVQDQRPVNEWVRPRQAEVITDFASKMNGAQQLGWAFITKVEALRRAQLVLVKARLLRHQVITAGWWPPRGKAR